MVGAKLVILTDLPQQIPHLEANVQSNRHLFTGEVICIPFSFGEMASDLKERLRTHSSPLVHELLLSSPKLSIDFLIGADIAYDVSLLPPLSTTISSLVYSASASTFSDSCGCVSYLVETGNLPIIRWTSPLPVRWRDIYQWFLESLTEQNEEAGPTFQPLTLQETVELFKRGTSSSSPSGGHTSMTSLSAELDHHSATIDLESSFSRADVILHIFTQEP
jgi:hypothetical protein